MTTRLDQKLANIRAGRYKRADFIIADAKDPDMGPAIGGMGPKREADGSSSRYRTRQEFLDEIRALIRQDILDIMLVSASNLEALVEEGAFRDSRIKPAIRANDATDIWQVRNGAYVQQPSRPFRSASLPRVINGTLGAAPGEPVKLTDLGLYSITFNNDLEADLRSLEAFRAFREEAGALGFKYFLEVFNPNAPRGLTPEQVPAFVNDCIARCLAGVVKADRPQFLKIAYNGPKALEELASFDPSLIVGVLGGGAGTTRDTFELLHQAERYGARVALFGRKINLAESQLDIVSLMREVADGTVSPAEAVKAYHGRLQKLGRTPLRPLEDDLQVTEAALKQAAS
ncbi:MAG: hypothetical protein IRY94_04765 [Rhodospirillaceae bacterium]|nr:hypothetical protein [Rhodospirillaceae bacterium]